MGKNGAASRGLEGGLPPVEKILGHLVRRAQQRHTQYFNEEFGGELTGPQFSVLSVLAGGESIDQPTVGRLTSLDRSTAADVILRLERHGWLRRERDPGDSRRALLTLTAPSRIALPPISIRVTAVQERLLAPLGRRERADLVRMLRMVAYRGRPPAAGAPRDPAAGGLDLGTTAGHLLRRVEQSHGRLWADQVESLLTPSQYAIVAVLASGYHEQAEAGAKAALDRSSAADILARLRRRDLVSIEPSPADRRRNEVSLTAAGIAEFRKATPKVLAVQSELVAPLTAAEPEALVRLLGKLAY